MGPEPGTRARGWLDRTTWIALAAVLAVGLAGVGLVASRVFGGDGAGDDVALPVGHLHGVVTVDGEPRPDVPVVVFRTFADGTLDGPVGGARRSTAEGRFVFNGLEPGTYTVTVSQGLPVFTGDHLPLRVAGLATTYGEAPEVELPADRGVDGVAIDLLPGATLSGRARTASGRPAADLPVRAHLLDDSGEPTGAFGEAVTDADGRYTFTGLPPGSFEVSSSDAYADPPQQRQVGSGTAAAFRAAAAEALVAAQDRRQQTLPEPAVLEVGGKATAPDLTLRRSAVLRGTVRGLDGRPGRDVQVDVMVSALGQWLQGPVAMTDRRGRFAIPGMRPGSYRLKYGAQYLGGASTLEESEPLVVRRRDRVLRLDLVVR